MASDSLQNHRKGAEKMDLKWEPGGVALGSNGLPQQVDGLEEILQNVALRLTMPRGSFLYGANLGSGLSELDPLEENSTQRAWALANETLMECPGVCVVQAGFDQEAGMWTFTVETPLGTGEVTVPGKEETDGEL